MDTKFKVGDLVITQSEDIIFDGNVYGADELSRFNLCPGTVYRVEYVNTNGYIRVNTQKENIIGVKYLHPIRFTKISSELALLPEKEINTALNLLNI